jgi:hypothetical protein
MAMVYIYGTAARFYTQREMQGIRIIFDKEQILVMVPDNFKEPVFRGKLIENAVQGDPSLLYGVQGITQQLFYVAVEHKIPAPGKIIVLQKIDEQFPVLDKIIPAA